MVSGNNPLPFDMTGGFPRDIAKKVIDTEAGMKLWDSGYRERARKWGTFLACEVSFLELYNPPIITGEMIRRIFGKTPQTQNPTPIGNEQFESLRKFALPALH